MSESSVQKTLLAMVGVVSLSASTAIASPAFFDQGSTSIRHIEDDRGNGNFWIKSDDLDLRANWEGRFRLNNKATGLVVLDGRLEITIREGRLRERVIFVGENDQIETFFTVNDRPQELNQETESRIAELVRLFVLESGLNVDERVADLHSAGGVDAVFSEINAIQGNHSRQKYLVALAEAAELNVPQLGVYSSLAAEIDGDHSKRKVVTAVIEHQSNLDPEKLLPILSVAESISGDHELRKVVEELAGIQLTNEMMPALLSLLTRISGDHEFRKAAESLSQEHVDDMPFTTAVLKLAAGKIGGDHELRQLIESALEGAVLTEGLAETLLVAVSNIGSDHEARKAISAIAELLPEESNNWVPLIQATDSISSDHEKRKALEEISEDMPRSAELVRVYEVSAMKISSESERKKALDELE